METLKQYQPELYREEGRFLNDTLIKHYCFNGEVDKLGKAVSEALKIPYHYDGMYLQWLRMLYHGYVTIVDQAIEQEYQVIKSSPNVMEEAIVKTGTLKYYIELEKLYTRYKQDGVFDTDHFASVITQFDYSFDANSLEVFEQLLTTDSVALATLVKGSTQDSKLNITYVELLFLKWMHGYNCPFYVSGLYWSNFLQFYIAEGAEGTWLQRLAIERQRFDTYINSLYNEHTDFSINAALAIWGAEYWIDFLAEYQLNVKKGLLREQKTVVNNWKINFKSNNKYHLWQYKFLHNWFAPKARGKAGIALEASTFLESYSLELPFYSAENIKELLNDLKGLQKEEVPKKKITPRKVQELETTIGRNDKVSVEYPDGTMKKDVKYKKVMNDVLSGKCKLL